MNFAARAGKLFLKCKPYKKNFWKFSSTLQESDTLSNHRGEVCTIYYNKMRVSVIAGSIVLNFRTTALVKFKDYRNLLRLCFWKIPKIQPILARKWHFKDSLSLCCSNCPKSRVSINWFGLNDFWARVTISSQKCLAIDFFPKFSWKTPGTTTSK